MTQSMAKKIFQSNFLRAVFLLVGTIIGAGIFSLPYVFYLSGTIFSLFGLVALTVVTLAINLFYSRIIVATKGDHQLPGYAHEYLGERGERLGLLTILLSSGGALVAYVILGGDFLAILAGRSPQAIFALLYWCLGAIFFWGGIKTISTVKEWLTAILVVLAIALPFLGSPFFRKENLPLVSSSPLAFFGPLLFALSGMGVIPEIEEVLRRQRHLLTKALVVGGLIPALVYLIFGFGILGISGDGTTADALHGLLSYSPSLVKLGAAVGFLSTLTSFLSLTNVLKEVFFRDLGWRKISAKTVALFVTLPAALLPLQYFLPVVSLTGTLAIGGAGLLVLTIFLKNFARSLPEKLLAFLVGLILSSGVASELMRMIK